MVRAGANLASHRAVGHRTWKDCLAATPQRTLGLLLKMDLLLFPWVKG